MRQEITENINQTSKENILLMSTLTVHTQALKIQFEISPSVFGGVINLPTIF